MEEHLMTERAKSEPPSDRRRPTPPPPPGWRNWLLVLGLVVSMLILFWPQRAPSVSELSYSAFLSRVRADGVATAEIDPSGAVHGT
jgi:cell division protease FtsH